MTVRLYTNADMPRGIDLERSFAFNRRPGARNNRGRIPAQPVSSGPAPTTPLTIFGANTTQWIRSDLGVSLNGSTVSNWADQSGNGNHYTQASAPLQPAYSASDATLNNLPTVTGDGVDDLMASALSLAAPGTTKVWIWSVLKQVSWTANDRLLGGDTVEGMLLYQLTASPNIRQFDGSNGNQLTALAVGSWGAVAAYYDGAATSSIQLNDNVPVSGTTPGNTACTGRRIFAGITAATGNVALAELAIITGITPSAGQLSQMSGYRLGRYGF